MPKFKLIRGGYGVGKTLHKKGSIITSDVNLVEKFPGMFSPVFDQQEASFQAQTPQPPAEQRLEAAGGDDKGHAPNLGKHRSEVKSALGDEVTKEFKGAQAVDLRVFRKGQGKHQQHHVTASDDVGTALNEKPLKADEVQAFVESYMSNQ